MAPTIKKVARFGPTFTDDEHESSSCGDQSVASSAGTSFCISCFIKSLAESAGSVYVRSEPIKRWLAQHGPDLVGQGIDGEGFGQHVHATAQEFASGLCLVCIAGHKEHFQARSARSHHLGQLATVGARQSNVRDQKI